MPVISGYARNDPRWSQRCALGFALIWLLIPVLAVRALVLLRQKLCVSRPSEARAGTQCKFAKFTIGRPWLPALRSP